MTSNKPYLLRALYEWIADNQMTPYIQVDVSLPGVNVPMEYVKDNQIVLNIAMMTVKDLILGNECIEFYAKFGGQSQFVSVPIGAIAAIFAKENGQGMGFEVYQDESGAVGSKGQSSDAPPHLTIVK